MKWVWPALVVLSPAILYGIALVLIAAYRGRCHQCKRRGLCTVGSYKWDGVTEDGRRCGGIVVFISCQSCGGRFKKSGSDWVTPTDEEWTRHVPNQAAAVNAPIAPRFQFEHAWRRITEQRRSAT